MCKGVLLVAWLGSTPFLWAQHLARHSFLTSVVYPACINLSIEESTTLAINNAKRYADKSAIKKSGKRMIVANVVSCPKKPLLTSGVNTMPIVVTCSKYIE